MSSYSNPYSGETFFGFFQQLFLRIIEALKGNLSFAELAPDELQLLVLSGIALSSALTGTFLILRHLAMLANALSHTILLGIVLVYLFMRSQASGEEAGHLSLSLQAMFAASLLAGLLTTFLTSFITRTLKLQEDASTGIVFSFLFALAIILVTAYTRNAHIGIEVVMGNVDALHLDDLKLIGLITLVNIILIGLFFKEFTLTTFDPGLARTLGFSTTLFHYLLMVQVSMTVVGSFRAVGIMMVLAFLTGPSLLARHLSNRLRPILLIASLAGILISACSVALSRHLLTVYDLPLSTGGLTVCLITLAYALTLCLPRTGQAR